MTTPKQQYRHQIGRCSRLVNILSTENLEEVNWVIAEYVEDLPRLKDLMISNDSSGMDVEIFDVYMRVLSSLLEYSDVFILQDIDRYKQSLRTLLETIKALEKGGNKNEMKSS